uniref:Uncharacterized protein n=1 Tax=Arundo donax TaxID=35708 RepID=A0A0A9BD23_ARUDO
MVGNSTTVIADKVMLFWVACSQHI